MNPYQLAHLAECATPDSETSPGALFLLDVEESYDGTGEEFYDLADDAVYRLLCRGTHRFYEVVTDLCAWQTVPEVLSDYGSDILTENPITGADPATNALTVALVRIAETLIYALSEESDQ